MDASSKRKHAVTSLDVAKAAGVSQSAVSRAFTPRAPIAEEKRQLVLRVAGELGYEPRAAVYGRTGRGAPVIAMVMADLTNPFYPEVLERFSGKLRDRGWDMLLHSVPRGAEIDDVMPSILEQRVTGVVITSATLSYQLASAYQRRKIPVVLFNRSVPRDDVSSVCCDNYVGGRQLAELLLSAGHRRIAFVAGREDTSTNQARERGFTDALEEAGVRLHARECGEFAYGGAREATHRLLNRGERPDAIFCANDIMAVAAIDVASRELHLDVPQDIAIVGFDDIPMAAWPAYRLTTIRQRINLMIDETILLLDRLIEDPGSGGVTRLVTGKLIERASTRGVAGGGATA